MMSQSHNFFLKFGAFSLAAALFAGCLTSLGPHGEIPEDRRAFLEIEHGLTVAFFDNEEVNWGVDSVFGGFAGIFVPAGAHRLRVIARKESSEKGDKGIIKNMYSLSAEIEIDFLPRHSYRLEEDGSFLDLFLGAYDLKVKVRDTASSP
jgi:hypothetical protein